MEHYYSKNPQVVSKEACIKANLRGRDWEFITDAGVFSKSGVDFGTRRLIESVYVEPNEKVLDLGCGYGVIGVVLGIACQAKMTMTDINERAISLAKRNCQRYQLANVSFYTSDGFESIPQQKFQHIITNPPIRAGKVKIYSMFEQTLDYLEASGSFWSVIHKKHGADSAVKKLENLYKSVEIVNKKSGYQIIKAHNS